MCRKAGIAIGMMGVLCLFEAFERRNLLASVPFPGFVIDGQYGQKYYNVLLYRELRGLHYLFPPLQSQSQNLS